MVINNKINEDKLLKYNDVKVIDDELLKYSELITDSVNNKELVKAKIYRLKIIELYEIKKEIFTLDNDELNTLRIIKQLTKREKNKSFVNKLRNKILNKEFN